MAVENVSYPDSTRNYCIFNENRIKERKDLNVIKSSLKNAKTEDEVVEDLYILNIMLDEGIPTEKVNELYSELSRYNYSKSPNIQTFLAGIYRKTHIPDAFGPLCSMLIQNTINPPKEGVFDPNEEIGGAILSYLA